MVEGMGTGDGDAVVDVLASLERSCRVWGSEIVSVYLFGSHAEGRAHQGSDVDVGVVLDCGQCRTKEMRFQVRLRLITTLTRVLRGRDVDVLILNDAPPQLARRIITHGQCVFRGDAAADHAFVRTAMLRAADLEPFLRRTRRNKLDAIRR